MAVQVETYECSETAAEPIEACEEAAEIMERLGLDGQKNLLGKREGEPIRRCPYREMTQEEAFVFGVLCPDSTALRSYDCSPIPLRVLQIAAHADSLGLFEELRIWHVKKTPDPDPVLIGVMPDKQHSWQRKSYLLARWANELESWPTLVKRAVAKKREQVADIYRTLQRKLAVAIEADELTTEELIQKGASWKPELSL